MSTPEQHTLISTPSFICRSVLLICLICAVSTLPWLWMAKGQFGGFAWGLFGFELIILMGSVMTIFVAMGKVRVEHGFPLAVACLVGSLLVGAVFGLYVDARAVVGDNPQIQPWITRTLMLRFGAIALLSLLATLDVYRRDARSWSLVIRSALFFAPIIAAGAWMKLKGLPPVENSVGEPSPVRMIIFLLAGLGFSVLLSISGHFLIRSFEVAFPEDVQGEGSEKTGKAAG